MTFRRNHYVPEWYQKRFLPSAGEQKYHFLDLRPDIVVHGDGVGRPRNAIQRWGPDRCFKKDDLYTTNFDGIRNTEIERFFFGKVDSDGREAVEFFSNFEHPEWNPQHLEPFLRFLSLQKI